MRFLSAILDSLLGDAGAFDSCSAVAADGLAGGSAVGAGDVAGLGSGDEGPTWTSAWGTACEHQPAAEGWDAGSFGGGFGDD